MELLLMLFSAFVAGCFCSAPFMLFVGDIRQGMFDKKESQFRDLYLRFKKAGEAFRDHCVDMRQFLGHKKLLAEYDTWWREKYKLPFPMPAPEPVALLPAPITRPVPLRSFAYMSQKELQEALDTLTTAGDLAGPFGKAANDNDQPARA